MAANRYYHPFYCYQMQITIPVLPYAASKAFLCVVSAVAMFYIEVDID